MLKMPRDDLVLLIAIVAFCLAITANCRLDDVCRALGAVNCRYVGSVGR